MLTGCGSSSSTASSSAARVEAQHPVIRTRIVRRQPSAQGLEPAVRGPSAAGACASSGKRAIVEFAPDVPVPRCIKAVASARLELVNRTGDHGAKAHVISFDFAGFSGSIRPDEAVVLAGPIGGYLKQGRHLIEPEGAPGPAAIKLISRS
jgi:hypothetical protein